MRNPGTIHPLALLLAPVVLLVAASCTAKRSQGDLSRNSDRVRHVITVDPDGSPIDPVTYQELPPWAFKEQLNTIAAAIGASGKKRLVIFVHGGLNNREAGQRHVDELIGPMSEDAFPLFLNWNSDLIDTTIEDLVYVRQGRVARYLGPLSAPFAIVTALGSGVLRAPTVWGLMLSSDLNASQLPIVEFPGKRNSEALMREFTELYASGDPGAIPIDVAPAHIDPSDSAWAVIRYAITFPTKLATSPIIDGFGQGAWRNMQRRTQMLFHREDEFDVRDFRNDRERLRNVIVQGPQGAAHLLFLWLQNYLETREEIEVTLIGHSMGAIVINRALRQFPSFQARDIVYMAAACSIDDFRTSVVPFLVNGARRPHPPRFHNITLNPIAEVREWQKGLLDLTPRGSLLVWIDNFLSGPQTTLDRTLGAWENVTQAIHTIPLNVRSRTSFKTVCIGTPGCTAPTTHGAFSDPGHKFWLPAFWEVPRPTR